VWGWYRCPKVREGEGVEIQSKIVFLCLVQVFKLEFSKNPTEEHYSNMEQQGKIVRRLEMQMTKQRVASITSDSEV